VNSAWQAVIWVGLGAMLFKAAGPVALGGRSLPGRLDGIVGALAPALLAALIATQIFGGDRELVLDARAVGLGAAAVLVALRAPILAVVAGAALATALARLV
jgi:uncharacterized membrane protein